MASNDTSLHLSFAAAALALLQPDTRSGADTRAIGPAFAGGSGTSSTAADAASAVVDVSRGMLVPMLGLRSLAAHVPELSQELAALLLQRHQWAFTAGLMRSAAAAAAAAATLQPSQKGPPLIRQNGPTGPGDGDGSASGPALPSAALSAAPSDAGHLRGADAARGAASLPQAAALQLLEAVLEEAAAAIAAASAATSEGTAAVLAAGTGSLEPACAPMLPSLSVSDSPTGGTANAPHHATVRTRGGHGASCLFHHGVST